MCGSCNLCCAYVTTPIEEPTTRDDIDHMEWLLIHKNIWVVKEGDGWYLQFFTPCKHNGEGCHIYEKRPDICRDYIQEECEKYGGEDERLEFKEREELLKYAHEHMPALFKK